MCAKSINKCSTCDFNEYGICIKIKKEIPLSYASNRMQKPPTWCPLLKNKAGKKYGKTK